MSRHEPVLAAVAAALDECGACPVPASPVQTMVVAVSGGPDSICLLDALSRLLRPSQARSARFAGLLHVAHLHHGLRGRAADQDAAFVERLARAYGWPVTVGRVDVRRRVAASKRSVQETAREARYQFLRTVAEQAGAAWIAVGHTANDQAETLLMRLLRGAGPDGLAAMPLVREGRIIRPLLRLTRAQLLDYARRRELRYRQDRSNRDRHYLRTRIRLDLLPRLARDYNPAIVSGLANTAKLMAEERQVVEELLTTVWERSLQAIAPHHLSFQRAEVARQPATVQRWWARRALRLMAAGATGSAAAAGTTRQIDELVRRIARGVDGAVTLGGGVTVTMTRDRIELDRRPAGARLTATP